MQVSLRSTPFLDKDADRSPSPPAILGAADSGSRAIAEHRLAGRGVAAGEDGPGPSDPRGPSFQLRSALRAGAAGGSGGVLRLAARWIPDRARRSAPGGGSGRTPEDRRRRFPRCFRPRDRVLHPVSERPFSRLPCRSQVAVAARAGAVAGMSGLDRWTRSRSPSSPRRVSRGAPCPGARPRLVRGVAGQFLRPRHPSPVRRTQPRRFRARGPFLPFPKRRSSRHFPHRPGGRGESSDDRSVSRHPGGLPAHRPAPPFHGGGRRELVRQPRLFALDTGLVCQVRGWTSLRPADRGPL